MLFLWAGECFRCLEAGRGGTRGLSGSRTGCGGCGGEDLVVSAVAVILSPGIRDLAPAPRPARPRHSCGLFCPRPWGAFLYYFFQGRGGCLIPFYVLAHFFQTPVFMFCSSDSSGFLSSFGGVNLMCCPCLPLLHSSEGPSGGTENRC